MSFQEGEQGLNGGLLMKWTFSQWTRDSWRQKEIECRDELRFVNESIANLEGQEGVEDELEELMRARRDLEALYDDIRENLLDAEAAYAQLDELVHAGRFATWLTLANAENQN